MAEEEAQAEIAVCAMTPNGSSGIENRDLENRETNEVDEQK